jgi:hypothetical protein
MNTNLPHPPVPATSLSSAQKAGELPPSRELPKAAAFPSRSRNVAELGPKGRRIPPSPANCQRQQRSPPVPATSLSSAQKADELPPSRELPKAATFPSRSRNVAELGPKGRRIPPSPPNKKNLPMEAGKLRAKEGFPARPFQSKARGRRHSPAMARTNNEGMEWPQREAPLERDFPAGILDHHGH